MILDATGWQLEPTPWSALAACRGVPGDLWFPERGASAADAKAVCVVCPVRTTCLDYALRWDIRHGIWGGMSVRERRRVGRRGGPRRLAAPHGTTTRYGRGCRCERCTEARALDQRLRVEATR